MAYEAVPISRFKARYDSDNDDNALTFQMVRAGAKVTPSSATIAIYQPGNSTAVLDATAMTCSGTLMTYEIDTTETDDFPVATGYRARIVVTDSGAVTYEEDIFFDVAELVPQGRITRDQLLKLDERVMTMQHAGDDDFSELIQACWEENQLDLESREMDGDQLLDSMVVDRARLSVVVRFLCLARILRPKGEREDAQYYEETYRNKLRQLLSGGVRHDLDADKEEDADGVPTGYSVIVN